MYLARLTDDGELGVWEIDPIVILDMNHTKTKIIRGERGHVTWRFGKPSHSNPYMRETGWAAIRSTARSAIAAVHAARECREVA